MEADWQAPTSGQRGVVNARLGALYDAGDLRWGAGFFTDRTRNIGSSGPPSATVRVDTFTVTLGGLVQF